MISDPIDEQRGRLADRQKPLGLGSNRETRTGMRVQNTLNIRSGLMDSPMNDEARLVDAQHRRVINNVALQIDLDKAGRRSLIVQQAKRVEPHMLLFARYAAGDLMFNAIHTPSLGYHPAICRGSCG